MIVRADTLYSNLPPSTPLSAETLPETVKRMIYASASAGAKEGGAEKALKFSAIWNKLERGVSLGATRDIKVTHYSVARNYCHHPILIWNSWLLFPLSIRTTPSNRLLLALQGRPEIYHLQPSHPQNPARQENQWSIPYQILPQ